MAMFLKCIRIILMPCLFSLLCAIGSHGQTEEAILDFNALYQQTVTPVCEACECSNRGDAKELVAPVAELRIVCREVLDKKVPSLDTLEWPQITQDGQETNILGWFNELGLTVVPKLPKSDFITYLNFDNNIIRTTYPAAFSDLPYLQELHLSNNDLNKVTPDIFTNLRKLSFLDLSYNKLSAFNPLDFSALTALKLLNLGSNQISILPTETLNKLKLTDLDLSHNQIPNLLENDKASNGQESFMVYLKQLNLASNSLVAIFKKSFEAAKELEQLDLSDNIISAIEEGAFDSCTSLLQIELSGNRLANVGSLPPSVLKVSLQHNLLTGWPSIPDSVKALNLASNQITEIYNENTLSFNSLQFLNISGNMLSTFEITRPLPELQTFDISYNQLYNIPAVFSSNVFPRLKYLYVNGNPMKKLIFPSELHLTKLYANYLDELTSIDASSFTNLQGSKFPEDGDLSELGCLDVSISHCSNLVMVHENSFQGMRLCHLDLSSNNLTTLAENVADWSNLIRGVNLQENPWECECSMQWVLDVLLKDLYTNHPVYLHELRCGSPRALQGLRFVHWYKRGNQAFCGENSYSDVERSSNYIVIEAADTEGGANVLMGSSALFIAILVGIGVGLILVVGLIVYLVRGKYRHSHQVRKQMLKKRQHMSDAQQLNGSFKKENELLKV